MARRRGVRRLEGLRCRSCGIECDFALVGQRIQRGKLRNADRQLERHQFAVDAQRVGRAAEHAGLPFVVAVGGDVFDPAAEAAQCLAREQAQFFGRRLLVREPGVEDLLHRPRGLAELGQSHHARAALEGVERAAQRRELTDVAGARGERVERREPVLHHFARFFQEDVPQVVFFDVRLRRRGGLRGSRRLDRGGQIAQRRGRGLGIVRAHRGSGFARGVGDAGLFGERRARGKAVELRRQIFRGFAGLGAADHRLHVLRQPVGVVRGGRHFRRALAGAAHQRPELAGGIVIEEQLLRERRLVVQHVDQEAERAQVVAQFVEGAGRARALLVDFGDDDLFDALAHARHGLGRLVEPQYRQHTAHLGQVAGRVAQRRLVLQVAEELVEQFFELAERSAQLAHDAAHGLSIAHATIQLLHPRLERFGRVPLPHGFEPLRQPRRAGGQLDVGGVEIFEGRLEVEDGRRHFHRQFRAWRASGAHH